MTTYNRFHLIQDLIDKNDFKTYLEIGVKKGKVFFRVKARHKYAVDPEFSFSGSIREKVRRIKRNFSNLNARYYEVTSDTFFEKYAPAVFARRPLDIALVDGMHEYEYAFRDVENCLKYLSDNGVIIIHDCNPHSADEACRFHEWKTRNYAGEWSGDVWKVIVHLRASSDHTNAFVADLDHGLGIVTKRAQEKKIDISLPEIDDLTFDDLEQHRPHFLNLKSKAFLMDYFRL